MRIDADKLWGEISQSGVKRPYDAMVNQLVAYALMVPTGTVTVEASEAYLASEDWEKVRYRLAPKIAVNFAATGQAISVEVALKGKPPVI